MRWTADVAAMASTDPPSGGHRLSDAAPDGSTPLREFTAGETWAFVDADAVGGASASATPSATATPHVSLFSPHVPAAPPSLPLDSSPAPSRAQVGAYGALRSLSSSRSMPSLANIAGMTRRTARLNALEERPPIVQLQTRIDQAQKSADDPNTPLEPDTGRRTTMDLMRGEHSVRTDISRLFSESVAGSGSRAPSYNNATGPLYLRGIASMYSA